MLEKELLTADEAASYLNVTKRTILQWARERKIESVKISSKKILFTVAAIETFLHKSTIGVESETTHSRAGRKIASPKPTKKGGDSSVSRESWQSLRKEVATWQ